MTEWIWIFLVFWIFATVFGHVKKDEITRAIAGILGIVFGILILTVNFLLALGIILLNLYITYDAIE